MKWELELSWQLGVAIGIAALLGALIAYLVTRARMDKNIHALHEKNNAIYTRLQVEQAQNIEKIAALNESREQLKESFSALSKHALDSNNESFLQLAQQKLGLFESRAQANLSEKEKSIETMLKPMADALKKTEQQISTIEKERKEAFGSITTQLKHVTEAQHGLQSETEQLVRALRRPEVRGQWGELTLKRLAELAGMVNHCDFEEQAHTEVDDGKNMRPDMIVRMPEKRELIVDAKTPLDAYLSAVQSNSQQEQETHLKHHARKVRERMKELASKAYWSQFKQSPDFVILFIPGEQFLTSALDHDDKLLEDAFANRVILATPTTLVALLRSVAYGWQQASISENAEQVRDLAQDLYKRLYTFCSHLQKVGKNLDDSVSNYNKAIGSLERQVLPGARKFTELGIQGKEELPLIDEIEKKARDIPTIQQDKHG
ncbi:MAG: DNA recombination protein RmuC [Gammaproteobacteria bacterium]|nr:DNA recombination protein RmuC [Gammaproteobacteria bacterium]